MSFYIAKALHIPFEKAIERVTAALKEEGFGVMTDIDVRATLKARLGIDWRPYRILGACNPALAHQALQEEDKIGTMLPCNVIVQDVGDGGVEVGHGQHDVVDRADRHPPSLSGALTAYAASSTPAATSRMAASQ